MCCLAWLPLMLAHMHIHDRAEFSKPAILITITCTCTHVIVMRIAGFENSARSCMEGSVVL